MYKYTKIQEAPQSWSELWALEPGVYSWVQQAPLDWQPADTNSGPLRVELTIHSSEQVGGSHSFILSYIDGVNYLKRYFGEPTGDGNGRIAPIATATKPQEFDLPLADGITALQPCTYYKNQFSEVTLGGCTSGSVSDGATIATLPEGFRPDHPVERPATFTSNGNRYAGSVFISSNGIVSIHMPAAATNVVFAASFLAKN